jgi:hypothetical protein
MIDKRSQPRKASRRLSVFGLAIVVCLAMGAMVASGASALSFTWEPGGAASLHLETTSPQAETPSDLMTCESGSGTATFSSGTSGSAQLTLKGCKWYPWAWKCTSAGEPAGTIVLKLLTLTPVYLDAAKTKYGLKVSPETPGGPVAEFTCGGIKKFVWTGDVLGEITSPALNVTAGTFNLVFNGSTGTQQYEQIEGAGTKYHLSRPAAGGGLEPVSISSAVTMTLTGGRKGKFIP